MKTERAREAEKKKIEFTILDAGQAKFRSKAQNVILTEHGWAIYSVYVDSTAKHNTHYGY